MNDSNELNWQEVVDMARQRWADYEPGRVGRYPASEDRQYSYEEILAELRHVLRDTERFHRERPEKGDRAIEIATMAASRDEARVSAAVGTLGDVAAISFTGWSGKPESLISMPRLRRRSASSTVILPVAR